MMDYGYTHRAQGRIGTNNAPDTDTPGTVVVIFDGNADVYDCPDDLDSFRLWVEDVWEANTSRDLRGVWHGHELHLTDLSETDAGHVLPETYDSDVRDRWVSAFVALHLAYSQLTVLVDSGWLSSCDRALESTRLAISAHLTDDPDIVSTVRNALQHDGERDTLKRLDSYLKLIRHDTL